MGRKRGGEKEENGKHKKMEEICIKVVAHKCYSVTQEVSEPAWHLPWAGFTSFCCSCPGGRRLLGMVLQVHESWAPVHNLQARFSLQSRAKCPS